LNTFIMPADGLGAVTYYVIKNMGQNCIFGTVVGFLDNIKGKTKGAEFCSLPIEVPENVDKNAKVIIASGRQEKRFMQQLKELGFTNVVNTDGIMTPDNAFKAVSQIQADKIEQKYGLPSVENQVRGFLVDFGSEKTSLTVEYINFIVTQRCTLKCRDCCALMQYFSNPADSDIETINNSVDSFFSHVDFVRTLYIVGGEPFIFKDLASFILKISEYRTRIGCFMLATNGTIIPKDDVISALHKADVTVVISDYGTLSKKKDVLIELLSSAGVKCETLLNQKWYPMQSFSDKISEPEEIFRECGIACTQVMNGKLYYCDFAGFGDALRGFPYDPENSVDLFSSGTSKEKIKAYIERSSALPACGYCTGARVTTQAIPVAEQVSSPLSYKRYE